MHRSFLVFACAVLLAACRPAHSVGDEIDDLLLAEPAATQSEPVLNASAQDANLALPDEAPDYADQSRWHPTITPSAPRAAATSSSTTAPVHKPAPSSPFNPVPEPSAVVLAALALIYFLVFGRRRSVG